MEYVENDHLAATEVVDLYESVGWNAYVSDPQVLVDAIERSTFQITARLNGRLVGLARCLSDDFSIMYLQDLLVHAEHQEQGIGTALLRRCLDRFDHVRQRVLLTDADDHQHRLYRAAGFHDVSSLTGDRLHAFVSMRGRELS